MAPEMHADDLASEPWVLLEKLGEGYAHHASKKDCGMHPVH